MWQCPTCGEKLQVSFEICWNCGTAADGTEDPDFEKPDEPLEEAEESHAINEGNELAELIETPILKQAHYLTPDDFAKYPVWINCHTTDYDEPWYEETDE